MGTSAKLLITLAGTCAVLGLSLGIASAATYVTSWGADPGPGQLRSPHDVAIDAAGDVYVADTNHDRIAKFTSDGGFLRAWGGGEYPDPSRLLGPQGVAVFHALGGAQVVPGRKIAAGPADHQHPHRLVGPGPIEREIDLIEHAVTLGVAILRPVQGDHGQPVGGLVSNVLEIHGASSCVDCRGR